MSVEDKLKNLILQRYRSIREFTQVIDMPYSTFDTILKRGITSASVANIIKICKELNISADELAAGRIVHVLPKAQEETIELNSLLKDIKDKILDADTLTRDGEKLSDIDRLVLLNMIEATLETGSKNAPNDERLRKIYDKFIKNL